MATTQTFINTQKDWGINMFGETDWMREIDVDGAGCTIWNDFGTKLADGEVGMRGGAAVVMVDDDAHTVLTAAEVSDARYRVEVFMPAPQGVIHGEADGTGDAEKTIARHIGFVAKIIERASWLAMDHVVVTYKTMRPE